jgi:hypothetical protein
MKNELQNVILRKIEIIKPMLKKTSIIAGWIFGLLIILIGLTIPKTFTETLNQINVSPRLIEPLRPRRRYSQGDGDIK